MKRCSGLALACLLFLHGACLGASPPSDAEIRRMLATRVDAQQWATGIVVGITTPGGRRVIAYGTTEKNGGHAVDGDTVYDIGSITKVFTALVLADMARRGELALDDPVAKHLPPALALPHDGDRQITLADLATHTSGLPLRPDNLVPGDPDNKYAGYTQERLFAFVSGFKPTRPIGSEYEYSNVGFGLLGNALAHRARKDYATLVRARITGPLGMNDTRIEPTAAMRKREAAGYGPALEPLPHWDMGALAGAGALRSTANDLMRLLEAMMGGSAPLAADAKATLATRRPGGMQPSNEIALAWNVLRTDGREIAWKNGNVGGYRSFLGYDPAARIGVVALANALSATGADDIGLRILGADIPVDLHVPREHHEVAIDPALLERYDGRYKFSETDIVTVSHDGARLFVQPQGPDKLEAYAEGERDFFLKIADIQFTFEPGPDGKARAMVWHQGGQDERGERIE